MTRPALALFAAAVVCAPAAAQTKEIDAQVKKDLGAIRQVERTEDVEVLRRILNKVLGLPNQAVPHAMAGACNTCHTVDLTKHPGYHPNTTQFDAEFILRTQGRPVVPSPHAVGPFDGVYLPGHGVVFTLKIPAGVGVALDSPAKAFGLLETCLKCHTSVPKDAVEPSPSAAKPATEWDATRAELSGQKPKDEPKPTNVTATPICEPGKMTEAILTKLRENAGHVRHLAPTDRVTVVVTFDGYTGSARDRYVLSRSDLRYAPNNPYQPMDAAAAMMMQAGSVPARPGFTTEETQQLNLGDLHLKQNKPKDAAAAYEKALARFKESVAKISPPLNLTAPQKAELVTEFQKGVRDAYRRLAQAFLADNQAEKAQAALDLSRNFRVELAAGAPPVPGIPVPAKLVLGVTKADLDKAATDPAVFKKAVTVETVGFPPADKPAKPRQ